MTLEQLTTFFGWMSVLNITFLLLATIGLSLLRPVAVRLHTVFFSLNEDALNRAYFNYLANLKILTLVLCVAPWLALKLM
ncbi:hypothetical protein SAMN04488030_2380 [Aliiroseovarius halocynthiae]|uniref:DUF6868 domain-containing protein n=1 Tax=Aliiroseovarius halocynthiae TaxID=985055 RepID=A0A545SZD8_9RHOB|nr:hypothetical protein [Aliiroseovarius halocynthiae]TQV70337.1 hypothetical protein FIL88_00050 [Aliiroseovarius halocynthiae]SMR81990.1 hypothetical protein SAMN04488030_2380 [Aliiroseovarius halocynthiae]